MYEKLLTYNGQVHVPFLVPVVKLNLHYFEIVQVYDDNNNITNKVLLISCTVVLMILKDIIHHPKWNETLLINYLLKPTKKKN